MSGFQNFKTPALMVLMSVVFLTSHSLGYAETAVEERIEELEKEVQNLKKAQDQEREKRQSESLSNNDGVKWYDYVDIGLYLDMSYSYNFRSPANPTPFVGPTSPMRVFDTNASGFRFHMFQVRFESPEELWPEWVGFGAKVAIGQDAPGIASGGFSGADDIELQSAYVDLTAPLGNGLTFRAGKWETLLGAEVIESIDNYNFSRSYLFGFAIPFTHLGVLMSYPLIEDRLSVSAGVVNGWDIVADTNSAPSYIGQVAITPVEQFEFYINGITGPEDPFGIGADSKYRTVLDVVAAFHPTEKLHFLLNYDFGWEQEVIPVFFGGVLQPKMRHAQWQGFAGIVAYDFTDWFQMAFRGEYFRDPDGYRTAGQLQPAYLFPFGGVGLFSNNYMWETTLTGTFKIYDGIKARLEYRHDYSNQAVFVKDVIPVNSQDTLSAELMFRF